MYPTDDWSSVSQGTRSSVPGIAVDGQIDVGPTLRFPLVLWAVVRVAASGHRRAAVDADVLAALVGRRDAAASRDRAEQIAPPCHQQPTDQTGS